MVIWSVSQSASQPVSLELISLNASAELLGTQKQTQAQEQEQTDTETHIFREKTLLLRVRLAVFEMVS